MIERGKYQNIERGRQLLLFDGFSYGNITPTDIDGLIDFKNRIWIVFEAKTAGKETPLGQRLAIERIINEAKEAGKHGLALVVEHNTEANEDIHLRDCIVREVYTTERQLWRPPTKLITAKEAADAYIAFFEGKRAR